MARISQSSVIKVVIALIAVGIIVYLGSESSVINERGYIKANLDERAIWFDDIHIPEQRYVWLKFKDFDQDGDFDSYLQWKNSDGSMVRIHIVSSDRSKFEYPNLKAGSIVPHIALENSHRIDYISTKYTRRIESKVLAIQND